MQDLKLPAHRPPANGPGEVPRKSWRHLRGNWSAAQAICLFVFTILATAPLQQVHTVASQSGLIRGGHPPPPPPQNSSENPKEQLLPRHPRSAPAAEEEQVAAAVEENFHLAQGEGGHRASRARAHSSSPSNGAESNQHAPKLQIVRLFAPESVQNGTNVTIDCMFKYDKKLDQRLTIKWFFNDELEPIYQWIPELNKRVYSDRYERFIDKQYQVSEDVDFMLEAYKKLLKRETDEPPPLSSGSGSESNGGESNSIMTRLGVRSHKGTTNVQDEEETEATNLVANRRLLANRLNRLAKLGGEHSKHLLGTLRSALAMVDQEEEEVGDPQASQFRALRLIRPTVEMDGRYTCSVSSLDSEDLRSTRLVVYEPPKEFTFNVSKAPNGMYNLTCHAGPTYPQPSLALYRYRAGQLEPAASSVGRQRDSARQAPPPPPSPRLRLAAATLKQESLAGTQTQLRLISGATVGGKLAHDGEQLTPSESVIDLDFETTNHLARSPATSVDSLPLPLPASPVPLPYEISAWALVDETTLSANLVTQFECVLKIEGANYEQRQTLALEKGWHVNSKGALMSRTTLVGLMSVVASLLCLTVALASAILVFKMLREHANKSQQVHQRQVNTRASRGNDGDEQGGSSIGSSSSPSVSSRTTTSGALTIGPTIAALDATGTQPEQSPRRDIDGIAPSPINQLTASIYQQRRWQPADQSDGIYRVPEQRSSFGTRYVIGRGTADEIEDPNCNHHYQNRGFLANHSNAAGQQQQRPPPATISVNGKQLYC